VTDKISSQELAVLAKNVTKLSELRSAGFNHADVSAEKNLGIIVARVPAYSPYAIAEFIVGLILTLNRKIHRANQLD
jgi:D-lactate dehydrogenase